MSGRYENKPPNKLLHFVVNKMQKNPKPKQKKTNPGRGLNFRCAAVSNKNCVIWQWFKLP